MKTIRKIYEFKRRGIVEVEEYHQWRYGAPGEKRLPKKKPTPEQMIKINQDNKRKKCKYRLLTYFDYGDLFIVLNYEEKNRPKDANECLKHFQTLMKKVRREFKKQEKECYWIRNIEKGTRGAWHIHLVIKKIENIDSKIREWWEHGGTFAVEIKKSKYYDEDFQKLANYMTKDENTQTVRKDGTLGPAKLKEARYNTSRNMPLPEPKKQVLMKWPKKEKVKKGYQLVREVDGGINPFGYDYRRYTMVRMNGRC